MRGTIEDSLFASLLRVNLTNQTSARNPIIRQLHETTIRKHRVNWLHRSSLSRRTRISGSSYSSRVRTRFEHTNLSMRFIARWYRSRFGDSISDKQSYDPRNSGGTLIEEGSTFDLRIFAWKISREETSRAILYRAAQLNGAYRVAQ